MNNALWIKKTCFYLCEKCNGHARYLGHSLTNCCHFLRSQIVTMFCHSNLQENGVSLSSVIHSPLYLECDWMFFFLVGNGGGSIRRVTGPWSVPLVGAEVKVHRRRLYKVILRWNCNRSVVTLFLQRLLLLLLRPSLFKVYVARYNIDKPALTDSGYINHQLQYYFWQSVSNEWKWTARTGRVRIDFRYRHGLVSSPPRWNLICNTRNLL
jgi:hypothetical protein